MKERARKAVATGARTLIQGWTLAEISSLTATSRAALEAAGALQRVFNASGAQLVALPEVRVEETRPKHKRALQNRLAKLDEAEIQSIDEDGEITVLRPRSGRGEDALRAYRAPPAYRTEQGATITAATRPGQSTAHGTTRSAVQSCYGWHSNL